MTGCRFLSTVVVSLTGGVGCRRCCCWLLLQFIVNPVSLRSCGFELSRNDVQVDDNERTILELSPKFAAYNRVDNSSVMSELEKSFTKLRWVHELNEPPAAVDTTESSESDNNRDSSPPNEENDSEPVNEFYG